LTHGHPVTYISKIFRFIRYKMKDPDTGEIDYDEMRRVAKKEKPETVTVSKEKEEQPKTLPKEPPLKKDVVKGLAQKPLTGQGKGRVVPKFLSGIRRMFNQKSSGK